MSDVSSQEEKRQSAQVQADAASAETTLKTATKNGKQIVLIPQPTEDPNDPLVSPIDASS